VDPALFLSAARGPVRPHLRPNPRLNAPTRHIVWAVRPVLGGPVPARFWHPKAPEFRADKPFIRCLDRLAEWLFRNPFGSDRRDPKHTRAEQE